MPHSPQPPAAAASPGCVEGRRHRLRGRSNPSGTHVNCPPAAACRTTPSTAAPSAPSLEPSIRQALGRLYDQLRGPDEALSAAGLLSFIKREQKETRKPWLDEIHSRSTYSFPQFCDFWHEHASDPKHPIDLDRTDFSKPISNYYINSSHNTYIKDGDQALGSITIEQYQKVIRQGCRCVEIDVWNSPSCNDPPRSPRRTGQHWSPGMSLLSWARSRCGYRADPGTRRSSMRRLERTWALSDKDWDDTLEHEPRVCHCLPTVIAGDLSARPGLPFRLVCRAIREVAFEQTDLPLIISLEDHTTGDQHTGMVKIMREEWQGLLLEDRLPGCDPETEQPSVMDLKGKILIKGKRKPPKCVSYKPELSRGVLASPSRPSISASSLKARVGQMSPKHYRAAQQAAPCPDEKRAEDDGNHHAVARLAIYTYSPGPFKSFSCDDSRKPAHIFSFSEEKLKALHRTKHRDVFQHNKRYLARTFPGSARAFLSTNPNHPTLFWRKGVQMVSLNWQSWDAAMHLNDAMFDGTGGWVLKPEGYQSGSPASCQAHVAGKKRLGLCVTVLAGQNLAGPRPASVADSASRTSPSVSSTTLNCDADVKAGPAAPVVHDGDLRPRVKCYLHVEGQRERNPIKKLREDEICRETRHADPRHPASPQQGSRLEFPTVSHVVEELSFLRFRAENNAWACIRLDRLREGYRLIRLREQGGGPSEGVLLVKIEKTVRDEPPRQMSLRIKTWNACKKGGEEMTRLGSRWSCFGQGGM